MSVKIEGQKEFHDAIQKLIKGVGVGKVEPILKGGASIQTREARKSAPVRKHQGSGKKKPPGQLKKGVKTKQLQRLFGNPAPAISAIDYKTAPHAYLVHAGTGERVGGPRSKKYRGKRFGKMPAQPFFVDAWNRKRTQVLTYVEKKIAELVKGAAR